MTTKPHKRGFSLVELMVVIGIVTILLALLLPVITRVQERSRQLKCAAHLQQLGIGLQNYATNNHGWYPGWSAYHAYHDPDAPGSDPGLGWMEVMEPYYAKVPSGMYDCPSFPQGFGLNYFLR